MIIVKLQGGLGNQLFQYAFGKAMAYKHGVPLVLDASLYSLKNFGSDTPREYKLDNFNIEAEVRHEPADFLGKILSRPYLKKVLSYFEKVGLKPWGHFVKEHGMEFKEQPYYPPTTYYLGFFQSEKYFKAYTQDIRKQFTLAKPVSNEFSRLESKIKEGESVSIHIRRGDFLTHPGSLKHVGFADLSYFERAINYVEKEKPNCRFFVFSDDIQWAKKNIKTKSPITFISHPNLTDCEELILLSMCKHDIISNSTFSWWGAWLNQNPDKIVIRPKRWFNNPALSSDDLLPPDWIAL